MLKLNVEVYCNKAEKHLTLLHAPSCHCLSRETFSWGLTIDHLVLADSQGHAKNIKAFLLLNNSNLRDIRRREGISVFSALVQIHISVLSYVN